MAAAQPHSLWQKSTLAGTRQVGQRAGDFGHVSAQAPGLLERARNDARQRASRRRQGTCSHSGPGWCDLLCASGRVKVRD